MQWIGAAAGAGVAAGAAVLWRTGAARKALGKAKSAAPSLPDGVPSPGAGRSDPASDGQAQGRQPWHCECGQAFLVSGQDRHQIYWLEDADESDPVLSDHCPNCERPLPAVSRENAAD